MITVQTYGRCDEKTKNGRWGYKITFDDGSVKIERGTEKHTTANRMELTAIEKAFDVFCTYSLFKIIVESEYAKDVIDHNETAVFYKSNSDIIRRIYKAVNTRTLLYDVELAQQKESVPKTERPQKR